jgi:hypothetical protein
LSINIPFVGLEHTTDLLQVGLGGMGVLWGQTCLGGMKFHARKTGLKQGKCVTW